MHGRAGAPVHGLADARPDRTPAPTNRAGSWPEPAVRVCCALLRAHGAPNLGAVADERWRRGHRRRVWAASTVTVVLLSWQAVHSGAAGGQVTPATVAAARTGGPSASGAPAPAPAAASGSPAPSRSPAAQGPAPDRSARAVSDVDAAAAGPPVLVQAPVIRQLPELPNGCEVTSLAMLLAAVGTPVDKLTLAREQPIDPTQPVFGTPGVFRTIERWGDPNKAFVGNPRGSYGYGIYHGPLTELLERTLPGRSLDLTGRPFQDVLAQLRAGVPVLLWTTTTMSPPTSWVTWQGPDGPVRATQQEHAVLLVGASAQGLVVNNPLTGRRELVPTASFVAAWQAMGRQAVSVRTASG